MDANISRILSDVQAGGGVSRTEGVPLRRYRLADEELDRLRDALGPALSRWDMLNTHGRSEAAAAFCLFAAHHLRDAYDGGPWSWSLVTDSLDLDEAIVAPQVPQAGQTWLREVVRRGLAYWGRAGNLIRLETSRNVTRYLTTLAVEGGLPVKAAELAGNRFGHYLMRLVEARLRRPTLDLRGEAEDLAHLLPASWRRPSLYNSAAELVEDLLAAGRDAAGQADQGDAETLVRRAAAAGRLSIRADHAPSLRLAASLLDAIRADRPGDDARGTPPGTIRCVTYLDAAGRVRREVAVPRRITRAALSDALRVSGDKIPDRFRFVVQSHRHARPVARAAFDEPGKPDEADRPQPDQDVFLLDAYEAASVTPLRTARLSADAGTWASDPADIAGGEPLPAEMPWVFAGEADVRDRRPLVGAGAVATTRRRVLVALPDGAEVDASGATLFESAGGLSAGDVRRPLHLLEGCLVVTLDGEDHELQTSAQRESDGTFRFGGRPIFPAGPDGGVCWGGLPWVVEQGDNGPPKLVPNERVRWRLKGDRGPWRRRGQDDDQARGEVVYRVVDDVGRVRFASRCVVVPPLTRFIAEPDVRPGHGRLLVKNLAAAETHLAEEVPGTRCDVNAEANGDVRLDVSGDGERQVLRVVVAWPGGGTARLAVRSPVPVCGFRLGERLLPPVRNEGDDEATNVIGIDDLDLIYAETSAGERPYLAFGFDSRPIRALRSPPGGGAAGGRWVLPLREAQDLCRAALGAEDDGVKRSVRLYLYVDAHQPRRAELEVRSLAAKLHVRDEPADAGEDQKPARVAASFLFRHPRVGDVRLECRPLTEPAAEAVEADSMPAGVDGEARWRLPLEELEPAGPWLATAWLDGRLAAPARHFHVDGELPAGRLGELLHAGGDRVKLWAAEVAAMADDPAHELWGPVREMAAAARRVPPESFDALRAVAADPRAAAMLVACSAEPRDVLGTFERMPMLWALVPVDAWKSAFAGHAAQLRSALLGAFEADAAERLVREAMAKVVTAIGEVMGLRGVCAAAINALDSAVRPTPGWPTKLPPPAAARLAILGEWGRRRVCIPPAAMPRERATLGALTDGERWGALVDPRHAAGDWAFIAPLLAASLAVGRCRFEDVEGVEPRDLKLARAADAEWFDAAFEFATGGLLHGTEAPG